MDGKSQLELNQYWQLLCEKLSHNVIAQLACLRLKNGQLKTILPKLIAGYEKALANNLIVPTDDELPLNSITELADTEDQVSIITANLLTLAECFDALEKEEHNLAEFINNIVIDSSLLGARKIDVNAGSDLVVSIDPQLLKVICVNIFRKFPASDIVISIKMLVGSCLISFNVALESEITEDDIFNEFLCKQDGEVLAGLGLCNLILRLSDGDIFLQKSSHQLSIDVRLAVKFLGVK